METRLIILILVIVVGVAIWYLAEFPRPRLAACLPYLFESRVSIIIWGSSTRFTRNRKPRQQAPGTHQSGSQEHRDHL